MICEGKYSYFCEVTNMIGLRSTLSLLSIALNCCLDVPIASSQNLTEEWVEKAAAPLVENRVADGLSIGYIEDKHWGIVHLGTSNRAKKKASNLTVFPCSATHCRQSRILVWRCSVFS